jgi:hypothetical protein
MMTNPTRTIPTEKYSDWRKMSQIKRFDVADDRKALYYVTGGGRLLVLTEREFCFLAGLFDEEFGNIRRAEEI